MTGSREIDEHKCQRRTASTKYFQASWKLNHWSEIKKWTFLKTAKGTGMCPPFSFRRNLLGFLWRLCGSPIPGPSASVWHLIICCWYKHGNSTRWCWVGIFLFLWETFTFPFLTRVLVKNLMQNAKKLSIPMDPTLEKEQIYLIENRSIQFSYTLMS